MNLLTPVSALMSKDLITIGTHTPLEEAAGLLRKHGIHHLPVVDAGGGLEGIVSKSDFLKVARPATVEPSVSSIMTTHLAKLEPEDTVRTAASLFALNRFHALPVVRGGKIVGIITTLDLIKFIDREVPKLEDYRKA
jgi:CBS domain-containing protein